MKCHDIHVLYWLHVAKTNLASREIFRNQENPKNGTKTEGQEKTRVRQSTRVKFAKHDESKIVQKSRWGKTLRFKKNASNQISGQSEEHFYPEPSCLRCNQDKLRWRPSVAKSHSCVEQDHTKNCNSTNTIESWIAKRLRGFVHRR